jgi:hypothetical protein
MRWIDFRITNAITSTPAMTSSHVMSGNSMAPSPSTMGPDQRI